MTEEKKTTKRKLSLVTDTKPEAEKEAQVDQSANTETPVQIVAPHTEVEWHPQVNGVNCYGYTSQELLDAADRCYKFYHITPTIFLWGEVVCNGKPIRIKQETAEYVNVTDDHWHLLYSKLDIEPVNGVFPKARIGVTRAGAFERYEETNERKVYRAKLVDSVRLA